MPIAMSDGILRGKMTIQLFFATKIEISAKNVICRMTEAKYFRRSGRGRD